MLGANRLVGTDLTLAVPLTLAAALGALAFGHIELGMTRSLIIGCVAAGEWIPPARVVHWPVTRIIASAYRLASEEPAVNAWRATGADDNTWRNT